MNSPRLQAFFRGFSQTRICGMIQSVVTLSRSRLPGGTLGRRSRSASGTYFMSDMIVTCHSFLLNHAGFAAKTTDSIYLQKHGKGHFPANKGLLCNHLQFVPNIWVKADVNFSSHVP
jgi:hypothetical protein